MITNRETKAVYLADPDNRESITAVECICADGSTIAPMLILKVCSPPYKLGVNSHTIRTAG